MATTHEPCPGCGADAEVRVGQQLRREGHLTWSRALQCGACGCVQEADSVDALPGEYRDLILAESGRWELVVPRDTDRRQVAAVAREAFALGVEAAVRFAASVPGVVWSATEREVAWLGRLLALRGVISFARRTGGR